MTLMSLSSQNSRGRHLAPVWTSSGLTDLPRLVPTLSLILLTHATRPHLAAFAHCCKHFPLFTQIPVYATTPVINLGRTLLLDLYTSTPSASAVIPGNSLPDLSEPVTPGAESRKLLYPTPTPDEINSYFTLINPLKYSQPHQPLPSPFSPPLNGLTITAYNAGHTLGGTIWHIQHGMESVVYAMDWNQTKENIYSGAAWLSASRAGGTEVVEQLRKPTALVCSTKGCEVLAPAGGRAKRDETLIDMARSALARGGTVLIPTDSSARVLELAYLFEQAWRKESTSPTNNPFKNAKLYCASKTIGATMRYARGMMEWMDDSVVREFEAEANETASRQQHRRNDSKQTNQQNHQAQEQPSGPFEFKYLKLIERRSHMEKALRDRSQIILASDECLDWGFSKDTLTGIVSDPANLVILTQDWRGSVTVPTANPQSLGQTIWRWYQERSHGVSVDKGMNGDVLEQVYTGGSDLTIFDATRENLEGRDLVVYQQFLATQRQVQNTLGGSTGLENGADAIDDASSESSSSSEDSDSEQLGKSLNFSTIQQNKIKATAEREPQGVAKLLVTSACYDWDVRGKKGRDAVFPVQSKRRKFDDYGELIRPEDYLKAEERDAADGHDLRDSGSGKGATLGLKRRWGDTQLNGDAKCDVGGRSKRRRSNHALLEQDAPLIGNAEMAGDGGLSSDSDSEEEAQAAGPSKLVYKQRTVQANFRIAYVNCSGLHDQRSLSMLIPLIGPRKLILVGGTASETAWLANECRQKLRLKVNEDGSTIGDVFTPSVGERVTASMDTKAWTVKLSEALVRRLQWQNVRGLGVVTLTGRLAASLPAEDPQSDGPRLKRLRLDVGAKAQEADEPEPQEKKTEAEPKDLPPTLDVLPPNMAAATRSVSQPVHVGDLRLADLRRILQTTGHNAEFRGEGTLLIDGLVAVRKSLGGQIEVEGVGLAGPETFRRTDGPFQIVRQRIYEGLAVIAGGA